MPNSAETVVAWGVTVKDVVALASQADVTLDPTQGTIVQTDDDEFARPNIARRITVGDVTTWINDAAAVVDIALRRRSRLTTDIQGKIEAAGKSVIAVRAAAYLVDAAYPQRTGVQDQASYGQVLWNRYRQDLAALEAALEDWISTPAPDATGAVSAGGGSFPPAVFTDRFVRENTGHLPGPFAGIAPGSEIPYWR